MCWKKSCKQRTKISSIQSFRKWIKRPTPCVFTKITIIYIGMICKLDVALWLRTHFQTDSDLLYEAGFEKIYNLSCQKLVIKFTFRSSCDLWFWYPFVKLIAETKSDILSSSSGYIFMKKWQKTNYIFVVISSQFQKFQLPVHQRSSWILIMRISSPNLVP